MASVIQMLVAQDHRLVIPFSLKSLCNTLTGTRMPLPHGEVGNSLKRRADPGLQTLATHLTALTDAHTSLPMALARATSGATEWEGLGLLSGSSIYDITTALSIFCARYSAASWGDLLKREMPELTDDDIEWLCGLTEAMESQEPFTSTLHSGGQAAMATRTRASKKRCSDSREGKVGTSQNPHPRPLTTLVSAHPSGRKRKSEPSAPVRKSARLGAEHLAPGTGTLPEPDTRSDQVNGQPPSPLAASQRPYRVQLSRARRTLHGSGPRTGLLYFLQIFTNYLQFLGEHYPATGQDPVIFLETDDLMPTKGWKAVASALDRNQPTTTFLGGNRNNAESPLTDRSSGIGPIHGIEP
jgi:hypothetical protein